MCIKVTCKICKKPTWSGCGEHIEDALFGVAIADRCASLAGEIKKEGLLSRLFKR